MKSLLEIPSKEFVDFIGTVDDYQQTGKLRCTFSLKGVACFCHVTVGVYSIQSKITPIDMSGDIGEGAGVSIVIVYIRDDTARAMSQLTTDQIEAVVEWMNTWEQLKNTVIPIRFKEDFTKGLQRGNPS